MGVACEIAVLVVWTVRAAGGRKFPGLVMERLDARGVDLVMGFPLLGSVGKLPDSFLLGWRSRW